MRKELFKSKISKSLFLFFSTVFVMHSGYAQDLFIGSGGEFFLKSNTNFTTSNSVVSLDTSAKFILEAGSDWGSEKEYVDGRVEVKGSGKTKLPTGDNGVYAPVEADHSGDIVASYFNASPLTGSNGADVDAVSSVEYWEITGNASVTLPWKDHSDITSLVNNNGGELNSVAIVGYENGVWNLISGSQTNTVTGDLTNGNVTSDVNNKVDLNKFMQFTFGIDHQVALAVEDLFVENGIHILSNPIQVNEKFIRFKSSDALNDIQVSLYDITGRRVNLYHISTFNNVGSIPKPNIETGVYFLKFDYQGKQGVKKIILK